MLLGWGIIPVFGVAPFLQEAVVRMAKSRNSLKNFIGQVLNFKNLRSAELCMYLHFFFKEQPINLNLVHSTIVSIISVLS
jgi:hypothetical protein